MELFIDDIMDQSFKSFCYHKLVACIIYKTNASDRDISDVSL